MVTNIPMWIAIFITLSHACEVTDVLSGVMIVVNIDMFPDENANGLAAVTTP